MITTTIVQAIRNRETTMKTKTYRCPNCGNTKPSRIEDNGLRVTDPDLTLLCTARVLPGEEACPDRAIPAKTGDDGMVTCGMQWCPNMDEEDEE